MKKIFLPLFSLLFVVNIMAQKATKKSMDHSVYNEWNSIQQTQISNDGRWIIYNLNAPEHDPMLNIYDHTSGRTSSFERATGAKITADNAFLVFTIKAPVDSVKQMRRDKVEDKDLPKDTLAILQLSNFQLHRIPRVKSFQISKKSSELIAYHLAVAKPIEQDSSQTEKLKKESKDNGSLLVIRSLKTMKEDSIPYVVDYQVAEEAAQVMATSTGDDQDFLPGVYLFNGKKQQLQAIQTGKAEYKQLSLFRTGEQLSFLADRDTTNARYRPYELFYWKTGMDAATIIADGKHSFLPKDWHLSEHKRPSFSEDGKTLYFGMAPYPILQDTNILAEEIVNVEVWSYLDNRLHTQQKVNLEDQKKKHYLCAVQLKNKQITPLHNQLLPELRLADEGNATSLLAFTEEPYYASLSWEGFPSYKDVYTVNRTTGKKQLVGKKIKAEISISPAGQYLYWYSYPDSAWFSYHIEKRVQHQLTTAKQLFYDEINDRPMHPFPYGTLGWETEDRHLLLYDRYDIWKVDPDGKTAPINLTKGRQQQHTYRYLRLEEEARAVDPKEPMLLHYFNHQTKASGYARLSLKSERLELLIQDDLNFSRRPMKAQNANTIVFTKESFRKFPDLQRSEDLSFKKVKQISNANPQQANYHWGTIEPYQWTAANGEKINGMLVKPDNFDPQKKYPLLVNFYERSSDRLHRHIAPAPHRSTINYSFYASRGYLIFNPDVPYKVGYPGESAFDAVISGVSSLIDKGFVDKDRIGVQGHSWGGYQVAHLVTKTNIFKCAESGAPVVNMISAYGGIRWRSGLSRMFQYEHTQSRIGGTIWEYPLRYMENSPIFFADKIETPVLILHNDKDGAVPWYQGIEFFVALRRLQKPAWLLNYNDEPHWPVKWQNRVDFNIRMQQFFDHYLQNAPKPQWMENGVPAIDKGIHQGLELLKE